MDSGAGLDTASIFRGAGVGMIFAAVMILVATAVLYLVEQPTASLPFVAGGIAWAAILASGFSAARRAGRAGLWHGALSGLLLFLALYVAGVLGLDAPVRMLPAALRLLAAFVVGSLGGIVGAAL